METESQLIEFNCVLSGEKKSDVFTVTVPKKYKINQLKSVIRKELSPRLDHNFFTQMNLYKLDFPPSQLRGSESNLEELENPLQQIRILLTSRFTPLNDENIHLVVRPMYWREIYCNVCYDSYTTSLVWNVMRDMVSLAHFKNKFCSSITDLNKIPHQQLEIKCKRSSVNNYAGKKKIESDIELVDVVWGDSYRVDIEFILTVIN